MICNPCPHGNVKSHCKECGSCEHGRRKYKCKECNACSHGILKYEDAIYVMLKKERYSKHSPVNTNEPDLEIVTDEDDEIYMIQI